eukprot:TRINITY_DN18659_c0_g1_i4.p1 TRINITY_DN18659_c0_g1~~TRINITY_DN18659_c0_g1_i4.p1  ORF type:complete len:365 (+),score=103.69 TRINITY_DN18659_c0_g1_i4:101-1195(+)
MCIRDRDEPTNHLDLHACIWLEHTLQTWPCSLLLVSHDTEFLNSVCTDIIHFDQQKLTAYRGNYDDFARRRADQLALQQRQHDSQTARRQHIQKFIDKFRYSAARASQAQSRIKALEKMSIIPPVLEDDHMTLSFPECGALDAAAGTIKLENVTFGWTPDKILFKHLDLSIRSESRIALVGASGAEKSSLMKLIGQSEQHPPLAGFVNMSRKCRIGYFTQHHVDQLDVSLTPLECLARAAPGVQAIDLRAHLGTVGLSGDIVLRAIDTLSGGQKSRVAFGLLTWMKPHCLLLDEPTNHLDIDTIDALVQALMGFEGGIMVISHDERLISAVCDELWVCGDGKVAQWPGDGFESYKASLLALGCN